MATAYTYDFAAMREGCNQMERLIMDLESLRDQLSHAQSQVEPMWKGEGCRSFLKGSARMIKNYNLFLVDLKATKEVLEASIRLYQTTETGQVKTVSALDTAGIF